MSLLQSNSMETHLFIWHKNIFNQEDFVPDVVQDNIWKLRFLFVDNNPFDPGVSHDISE